MTAISVKIVDSAKHTLSVHEAIAFVSDAGFGGVNVFVGCVRESNLGRAVSGISYDMFQPLVLARFAMIAEQIQQEFDSKLKIYIAHAFGRLAVSDLAVVIAVATPHRDEAYRASRKVIEAVKHSTPIWKQEHYLDGDSVWSEGCSLCESPHS